MVRWGVLFFFLGFIPFRQALERRAILNLAENLFLVLLIQFSCLSWTSYAITLVFFLSSAFFQTTAEYSKWDQETASQCTRAAQLSDMSKAQGSRCPSSAITPESHDLKAEIFRDKELSKLNNQSPDETCVYGKVTMYPCSLRHIRVGGGFKDDYTHSYLYIGVPLGLRTCYSPLISVDLPSSSRPWYAKTVFKVRSQDQGFRGGEGLSLREKIDEFLLSEGENPCEWAHIYFLCQPRVNRPTFSPLSFFYLYTPQKELGAMIIQLDTSYMTRRLWFARNIRESGPDKSPYTFRCTFDKDLQVSPFTPVQGVNYIIDSSDPLARPDRHVFLKVNMRKGTTPIMVARVASTSEPLDVANASFASRLVFLTKWWYIPTRTCVRFRILSKALETYLRQPLEALRIQTRREQIKTSIAQPARISERLMERYFSILLSFVVSRQATIKSVTYETAGEHCERIRILRSDLCQPIEKGTKRPALENSLTEDDGNERITFKVLDPKFYARFFHYNSPQAAINRELLDPDDRTHTAWCSHPEEFGALFSPTQADEYLQCPDWRWKVISKLRTSPPETNFPHQVPWEPCRGISMIDSLILQHCTKDQIDHYRRSLFRLFLSHRLGAIPWPVATDFELIDLSRDAVVMICEAILKSALSIMALVTFGATRDSTGFWDLPLAFLCMGGLNLWACFKSIL